MGKSQKQNQGSVFVIQGQYTESIFPRLAGSVTTQVRLKAHQVKSKHL